MQLVCRGDFACFSLILTLFGLKLMRINAAKLSSSQPR